VIIYNLFIKFSTILFHINKSVSLSLADISIFKFISATLIAYFFSRRAL